MLNDARLDELVDNFMVGQPSLQVSHESLRRFAERVVREATQADGSGGLPDDKAKAFARAGEIVVRVLGDTEEARSIVKLFGYEIARGGS